MFIAKNIQTNELVSIDEAHRHDKYCCPVCNEPVIIKRGQYKMPHFAHARYHLCQAFKYKKESPLHLSMKQHIYQLLRRANYDVSLEFYIKEIEQIPDVLVNDLIVIEVQCSSIPYEDIKNRSNGYYQLGLEVIWIIDYNSLNFKHHLIELTQFQQSLICGETLSIFAFDNHTFQFHQIYLFGYCHDHKFLFYDEAISINQLLNRRQLNTCLSKNKIIDILNSIKSEEIHSYIKKCRRKRNINDLTLTAMYYAKIYDHIFPEHIGMSTMYSLYCKLSPVTWQMLLHSNHGTKLLMRNSFFLRSFYNECKIECSTNRIDLLITEYYDRINNIHKI